MQEADRHRRSWLKAAGLCLVFVVGLSAEGRQAAGASCADDLGARRSFVEQKAWQAFIAGETFNMAEVARPLHGRQALSASFLREVLSCTGSERIPGQAIAIRNAVIVGKVDLSHRTISLRLECDGCLLHEVSAVGSQWNGAVVFRRTVIQGTADLSRAHFRSSLQLIDTWITAAFDVSESSIDGGLAITGVSAVESIEADSAEIGRSLELSGLDVKQSADFWGIDVAEDLIIDHSLVGSEIPISRLADPDAPIHEAVLMQSAKIGRRITIGSTQFNGGLDMDAVRVSEDLWLRDCSLVAGSINLVFARIGQNVDFSSTTMRGADLTGARIEGELRLGAPDGRLTSPVWARDGQLLLRNTEVSSWTDATGNTTERDPDCMPVKSTPDPWPAQVDLIGFSYRDVEGLGGSSSRPRDADWFCQWLGRQVPYSFEPYQHAAAYLRQVGLDDSANDVLYCGKVLQITHTPSWIGKASLQIQRAFVGFGYKVDRSIYWALLFIIVGQQIFCRTPEAKKRKMPIGLIYSIDMFVPPLSLRRMHHEIDLAGWQRYYFYVHKFMGWVLGSFVLATLLGVLGGPR